MRSISAFFSLLFIVMATLTGHDSDAARNLLLQAQLADARSAGGETFRVNATFAIFNDDKQIGTGTYELAWTSLSKWREKVSSMDFSQLRIKDGDGIWEARQPAYQSLRVWQLMQALAFSNRLSLWKDESVGSIKTKQKNGVAERCVEVKVKLSGAKLRDLCFNDVSELLSEHYIPSDRTYEFTNYSKIGAKTFPREIKVYDGKKLALEFSVTEIEQHPPIDSSVFVRPPDVKWRNWCANPGPAIPLPIVVNHPPHEWHVTLFGTIGTDGRWHDLHILESGGSKADASVLDELKSVRFKPATCDGVPVTVETAFRR